MVCLGNKQRLVIFEIAPKYCILDSSVDYDGYSISSKYSVYIYIYIYIYIFLVYSRYVFFFIMVHYRILNIVPCAIQ